MKSSSQETIRGDHILMNKDVLPLKPEERNWKAVNFALIWMGCIHNIPTYATVGGLISIGLSPWQVLGIIATASLVLYIALALNSHAGAKCGVTFPVLIRSSFGIFGANIPALLRGCRDYVVWHSSFRRQYGDSHSDFKSVERLCRHRRELELVWPSLAGPFVVYFLLGDPSARAIRTSLPELKPQMPFSI